MDEKLRMKILEQLRVLDENYIPLVSYPIIDGDKKIFLGEKENRTCRFCGRSKADGVTFKKEAHALSNLIGNNSLFSYYECDECNQRFSIYEGDFAEFMKIYHCILKVKGKRGIPSYRMNTSRVDIEGTTTSIKQFEGDPTLQCDIDEVNKKTHNISSKDIYSYPCVQGAFKNGANNFTRRGLQTLCVSIKIFK